MKNMASTSPGGPPHPPCLSPTTQNGDLGDVHHSKTQDEIEIALTYICIYILQLCTTNTPRFHTAQRKENNVRRPQAKSSPRKTVREQSHAQRHFFKSLHSGYVNSPGLGTKTKCVMHVLL